MSVAGGPLLSCPATAAVGALGGVGRLELEGLPAVRDAPPLARIPHLHVTNCGVPDARRGVWPAAPD